MNDTANESEPTDTQLVRDCRQGHTQSFGLLYDRHHRKVRTTLYQLCGPLNLDDLTQEVFLRAWNGLAKFRQQANFSTWLYRITWNVASDRRKYLAKQRQHQRVLHQATAASGGREPLQTLHQQQLVQAGLEQLSLDHRSVLVLHDLNDVPQREIANILDIPVGTVKSRLHHARNKMKTYLLSKGVTL